MKELLVNTIGVIARDQAPLRAGTVCRRCGGEAKLEAILPKRFDSAAYEIFQCPICDYIDWIQRD
jgi:hypothetical protein